MTGSTLYAKRGNRCALVKTSHSGYELTKWIKDLSLNLSQFVTPKDVCLAYLEHIGLTPFDMTLTATKTVFEFECESGDNPVETLDKMNEVAYDAMVDEDEEKYEGYLSDYSDHMWFVDLDTGDAYQKTDAPVEKKPTYLARR